MKKKDYETQKAGSTIRLEKMTDKPTAHFPSIQERKELILQGKPVTSPCPRESKEKMSYIDLTRIK